MLGSLHRFHGNKALNYVYARGTQVRGNHVALRYTLNRRRQTYRIAVVVSRKVDKSAVVRNRIRRRIYEITRELCGGLTEPYDIVFSVYSNQLTELPSVQLHAAIKGLFRKSAIPLSAAAAHHAIVKPEGS
ncbi:MAG TPA: ribonuclease P protein component [Candidatus Saccharimonadales bacterium]